MLLILLSFGYTYGLKASHSMGADLTYTCLGGNQYRVSFSFYIDCSGITPSNSYSIPINSTSCGLNTSVTVTLQTGFPVEVSPLCAAQLPQSTCSGGSLPGVRHYYYEGIVTLPAACSDWVFSFSECCRNSGITTLSSPGGESLYIQAMLNNLSAPCNSSPSFTTLPVPYICAGQTYIYNHGAVDADGDSLVYTLVNALNSASTSVIYAGGFSGLNPLNSVPAVTMNSANGNVTMTPVGPQVGIIAVRVDEYRNGVLIGSTIRDIQITVLNCTNNPPVINPLTSIVGGNSLGPYSVEVCPGQNLSFTIPGTDVNAGQNVSWSWNNGIPGGIFNGPTGASPQNATFSWTPSALDVGLHALTVSLEDDACPVLGQQTRAVDIRVLAGTTAGPDQSYCPAGGPLPILASGGTTFTWTTLSGDPAGLSCFNCANPNAAPSMTSTYIVQSNLSGLCKNRDTITINVVPNFSIAMGPATTICTGGSTALSVVPSPAGAYTYLWSPGTNLSSTTIQNPTASPTANATYNVTVTSAAGCRISGSQAITVSAAVLTVAPTANPLQSCSGTPISLTSNAASGDCNQYTVSSITHAPVGGGGWTNVSLSDDQLSAAIPIGFNFNFFCSTVTDAYISANAVVTFDPFSGGTCCSGQNIPNASTPNHSIFVHQDDYAGNTPRYKTIGTAPNRVFIVHYNGAAHLSGGGTALDAQVMLYETSNIVEIHIANAGTDGTGETEGIENAAGSVAFPIAGRNATPWSATNSAHRFTPVPPLAFTVNWQAPLGTTVATGLTASVTPVANTTYFAVASNGICSATASVAVTVASASAGPDMNVCPSGGNTSLSGSYNGPAVPCGSYSVASIPFAPVAAGGTTLSLLDDELSAAIPMGFTFSFFCTNFTDIHISSNGFLSFDPLAGSGCCSGQILPDASTPNNVIAFAWDDLFPPGNGTIMYQTIGIAPNRRFVVSATGIPFCCGSTADVTTQVILYETTNIIEIHNTAINGIVPGTQGIENAGGTNGFAVTGRNGSGPWTATNDAFRFSPLVVTYSWSPPTFLSSTTIANPAANSVTSTTAYTLTVNNGNCIMTDVVNVNVCPLVENVHLSAVAEGNDARLDWVATNDADLDLYEIERSADGNTWTAIGQKDAVGQPGETKSYSDYDRSPVIGTNRYRLKMIDLNGGVSFSNLAELTFEGLDWANVTPNPSTGLFSFEIHIAKPGNVAIKVFAADGKLVREANADISAPGQLTMPVDLRDMPSGNYVYRIQTASGTLTGRMIKVD